MRNFIILIAIFFISINNTIAQSDSALYYGAYDSLCINNVNAMFRSNGILFWDLDSSKYEVPKGSHKKTIFASGLWIGGIDEGGLLHVAAETYRQNGNDFWPGPLNTINDSTDSITMHQWNKIWKVDKSDVDYHIAHFSDGGYTVPQSILDWPGNGDALNNHAKILAPFQDNDGDSIYEPAEGDYPLIKGDQAVYFIFNDNGGLHTESKGNPLGIEIHGMAYAYNCFVNPAIKNTIFLNYKFINRSAHKYDSTYVGLWMDFDIGNYEDDFVGCNVLLNTFYAYNGDECDSVRHYTGYVLDSVLFGSHYQKFQREIQLADSNVYFNYPPAQGVTILKGPLADTNDGADNNRNGITDEDSETIALSKFINYWGDFGACSGNPEKDTHYYYYLKGKHKDNSPYTYGGIGCSYSTPECDFMYPGNSDTLGWGTDMVPQEPWSEESVGNTPSDRRGVGSVGPFTFEAGATKELDVAFVFARDYSGGGRMGSVSLMNDYIREIQSSFDSNSFTCCCLDVPGSVYAGSNLLTTGKVYLYETSDSTNTAIDSADVVNGHYTFYNVVAEDFILYAVPYGQDSASYFSTYYANTRNRNNAYSFSRSAGVENIEIHLISKSAGINTLDNDNDFIKYYPNPANNSLTIDILKLNYELNELTIYDVIGNLVKIYEIHNSGTQTVSIENLSKGMYISKLRFEDNKVLYFRFIKE